MFPCCPISISLAFCPPLDGWVWRDVNILGISELKWTGMGEFNSDDHDIYSPPGAPRLPGPS